MRVEIELFEVEGDKLVPTKHCYAIEYLKAIMDNYTEAQAIKIFKYLQYMTCPYPDKNPFFNIPFAQREQVVIEALVFDLSLDDDLIFTAKENLTKMFDDTMAYAYKSMRTAVENICHYMQTATPTDGRDTNVATIIRTIEKYPKLKEAFDKIEGAYLESLKSTKVRGDGEIAYDEEDGR